ERAASAEAEIERLTHSAEHLADLEAQEALLLQEIGRLAGELSRRRRAMGDQLAAAVEGAMRDLAMPNVRFFVALEHEEDAKGVPVTSDDARRTTNDKRDPSSLVVRRSSFDKTGIDQIEF